MLRYAIGVIALAAHASAAPPPQWLEVRRLDAPEARQAAAADGRFVYAIDNSVIAQYDRETGRRIANSSGDASHLNSGFFRDGKLYCAHSNYPQKPEHSEIKVLDPATMRLSTYKDFGASAGSLTWCVFAEGCWWCNFAYYDAENGKTYLAKFDDAWREAARWTYPPAMIRAFGKRSASGGIWRDGQFLVTGHDDRELYVLELPAAGNVLRHVATVPVPFTGQGFADDPTTGGLVGIDRAKRQVVFARSPR